MRVAKVGRRQSRRTALFLLYQWDLTGQPLASLYDGTPDDFALGLAEAIADRASELDERITAAELVDGARVRRPRRGLDVSVTDGTARIELELAARFGTVLPSVAREVQANVATALLASAGLAAAVDVSIEELDL